MISWIMALKEFFIFGACVTLTARETSLEVAESNKAIRYYRVPFVDWFLAPLSDDFSVSLVGLPKEMGGETRTIKIRAVYKEKVVEFNEIALSKASRTPEYDFHQIGSKVVSEKGDSARYYLPSMAIGSFPVRLVMLE